MNSDITVQGFKARFKAAEVDRQLSLARDLLP